MAEELKIDVVLRNFASREIQKLDSGIARFARGAVSSFKGVVGAVFSLKGALAGLGVTLAAKQVFDLVKGTADTADKMRDLSIELGVSTEALSELEFAAKQSGAGMTELERGFRLLQKGLGEFAVTGRGAIKDVLGALSPQFKQLVDEAAPVEEIFQALSREIRGLGDAERVFVTSRLFGRGSGSKLIQLLTEDMDAARAAAKRFGLTISAQAANDADAFNDSIGELKGALEGLRRQAILPLLPLLTEFTRSLTEGFVTKKPQIIGFFADFIEGSGALGSSLILTIRDVEEAIGSIFALATRAKIGILGIGSVATDILAKTGTDLFNANRLASDSMAQSALSLEAELVKAAKGRNEALTKTAAAIEVGTKAAAASLRGVAKAQQEVNQAFAFVGPDSETFFARQAKGATDLIKLIDKLISRTNVGLDETFAGIDFKQLARQFKEAEEGLKRMAEAEAELREEAIKSGLEMSKRNQELLEQTSAVAGLQAGFRDLADESKKWGDAARDAVHGVADSISGGAADALIDFASRTKSAKEAVRDFATSAVKDIGRIIIQTLILKAIEGGLGILAGLGGGTRGASFQGGTQYFTPRRIGGPVHGHLEPILGHAQMGTVARRRGLYELREGAHDEAVVPMLDNRSIPVKWVGRRGSGGGVATVNQQISFVYNFATPSDEDRFIARNREKIVAAVIEANNSSLNAREGLS